MSSPIGQEAAFGVYQNSDRLGVMFSSLGDWYDVRTVDIATFWPGPSCSKLTTSLVNVSLKFQTLILQIHCKGFSHFFNKK